jgi:DNA-binding MarR family transcriptional regulator
VQASTSRGVSSTGLADELGLFLKHVLRSTHRDFFSSLQAAGISFTQLKCLGLLGDAGEPVSLGVLADEIGLSLPAVSRAVDGLAQRGELKREEDPGDRRSKLLTVTARGRATYERVVAVRAAGVRRFVEGLEPDEREALGAAVGPIVERLGR